MTMTRGNALIRIRGPLPGRALSWHASVQSPALPARQERQALIRSIRTRAGPDAVAPLRAGELAQKPRRAGRLAEARIGVGETEDPLGSGKRHIGDPTL